MGEVAHVLEAPCDARRYRVVNARAEEGAVVDCQAHAAAGGQDSLQAGQKHHEREDLLDNLRGGSRIEVEASWDRESETRRRGCI